MQKQNLKDANSKRSIWPRLVTFAFVLAVATIAISLLPRGFSEDTSLIGKGTNVLLLVHDSNILQSADTMAAMNEIRDEYAGRLEFIVADIQTPPGKAFADRNGFQPVALVFFSANGENLQTLYTPQTGASLRQELNRVFGY